MTAAARRICGLRIFITVPLFRRNATAVRYGLWSAGVLDAFGLLVDIEAVQRFVSFVTGADHAGADGEFDPETAAYRKLVAVSDSRRPEIPLVAGLPVFEVVESRAAVQADVMAVETPGPGRSGTAPRGRRRTAGSSGGLFRSTTRRTTLRGLPTNGGPGRVRLRGLGASAAQYKRLVLIAQRAAGNPAAGDGRFVRPVKGMRSEWVWKGTMQKPLRGGGGSGRRGRGGSRFRERCRNRRERRLRGCRLRGCGPV